MKTKKTVITIFAALTLFLMPTTLNAQESDQPLSNRLKERVVKQKTERSDEIESRLIEIKNMDMSELDGAEKRALRKEVREIDKTTSNNGGIYISIGGLLLVILLLIILL